MGTEQFKTYFFLGILALTTGSCEYYLGINQQPEFRDQNVEEGLNIFGLLRPDSAGGYNKSFVYAQQIWPVLEIGGYLILTDLSVRVEKLVDDEVTGTIEFPLVPSDSFFTDTLYRPLENFVLRAGERYRLTCQSESLPDAIGETVIPFPPAIRENTVLVEGRTVSFTLSADSLTGMIDIYLVAGDESQLIDRIVPSGMSDTEVELTLPQDPGGMQLKLFAYDANLAVYIGNSNTSLNFNKYRTTFSTLESGYGVFGSLNFSSLDLVSK